MGASAWYHTVAYHDDLRAASAALQRDVFERGEYSWPQEQRPTSLRALWHDGDAEGGTHSVLDLNWLIDEDEPDEPGRIRPLTRDERRQAFGTDRPTRADFDRARQDPLFFGDLPRWIGHCTVLYRSGEPDEIAIWGVSGD